MTYTQSFPIQFDPIADPTAVITTPTARFTILTDRLLRLEYSPTGQFEDRPSQTFWTRCLPVPEFDVVEGNGRIQIETADLTLSYKGTHFSPDNLQITLNQSGAVWHYGDRDPFNLKGTTRTLDRADGRIPLEDGLISRSGWAVYDDTPRLVFREDGWLEPRPAPPGYQDLYFFGYGQDYPAALRDFSRIAGPAPLIPRWALGNWWSRYWAYTAAELLGVMDEFAAHHVPLTVCIVDMDWHITDTGSAASGWTGYTWNRDLFPDPPAFLAALHQRGLKTALNLHPAEGVWPHEAQYEAMAQRLDRDPAVQKPIPFDITDPQFTRAYFELLHHPLEAEGVDFWWMDWQQGTTSNLSGLDPLPWLNHLHFYDLRREGQKRPFIFSRWGGLGSHRTPIGFSGDTVVSWESLAFQPYFTATAANVNYGWWSHDIGGHMGGVEEAELYTRWVQFGLFSPILRLHATNNPFHERRPWGWDAQTAQIASDALRLRHRFIPYLYSMAWPNHTESLPLIRPMYHDYPNDEQAYHCPDQYRFGSELLVAPFITPADPDTRLSRQAVWLPPGEWWGFFDGLAYGGDGWQAVYGRLADIPIFAKAGAIIPLTPEPDGNNTANPDALEIHLFPGADNQFILYEDDDLTNHSLSPIRQSWSTDVWQVQIGPAQGETAHLPTARTWSLLFRGVAEATAVSATINDKETTLTTEYDPQWQALRFTAVSLTPTDSLTVTLTAAPCQNDDPRLTHCRQMVRAFRLDTWVKQHLYNHLPRLITDPTGLEAYELTLTPSQLRALVEVISAAGWQRRPLRHTDGEAIILWNNAGADAHYKLIALDANNHPHTQKGQLPRFACLTLTDDALTVHIGAQLGQGPITLDNWLASLPDRVNLAQVGGVNAVVQFQVTGENGRNAELVIENGRVALTPAPDQPPGAAISAAEPDWLALINGRETPENLFVQGKLHLSGDMALILSLADAFTLTPPGQFHPDKWRLTLQYLDSLIEQISPSAK